MLDSIALSTYCADYLSLSKEHKSQGLGAGLLDKETSDSDPGAGKVISTLIRNMYIVQEKSLSLTYYSD